MAKLMNVEHLKRLQSSKTFKDVWGKEHEYRTQVMGVDESLPMLFQVAPMVASTLGKLAGALGLELKEIKKLFSSENENALEEFLNILKLDYEGLGGVITLLMHHIDQAGGADFLHALFKRTERDGHDLGVTAFFDTSYQGNFQEMIQVFVWLMMVNFGSVLGRPPTKP